MKVLLVAHGTRGDVQPLLALAVALDNVGHEALFAAPESFADSVRAHDVEFAPLDDGPNRLLDEPVVKEAIEGVRAIISTGWGLAARSTDDLLVIDQAPHDWLFSRVSAVVHHGGGGTTAAALAAGKPQVVCPFVADQPHWARRMHIVGVAPEPVPHRKPTADTLAAAISRAVGDPALRQRAGDLGELIPAENGVAAAVRNL